VSKILARLKDLFFTWEFVRYFISGVVATIVDLGVFAFLSGVLGLGKWYLSNFPAIVASVIVAYVMNRIWVFRSKDNLFKEFLRFTGTRIAISVFFTYLVYPILYYGLNITYELFPKLPVAKLIALLFVVLGNRVTGKFYVFKEEQRCGDDNQCAAVEAESVSTSIHSDDDCD